MNLKKIIFLLSLALSIQTPLNADIPHFLDFKLILNSSDAEKKAQDFLKKNLITG